MKVFVTLLLFSCLFGINHGQLTTAQAAGAWIDDGTNGSLNSACCAPATYIASAGTGTTVSVAGTWKDSTACTTLNIKSASFVAPNNALTSTTSPVGSYPVPFTYTYTVPAAGTTYTLTGKSDGNAGTTTPGVITWAFGASGCSFDLQGPTALKFAAVDSTWVGQYYAAAQPTTPTTCCFPVIGSAAGTDATNNVKIAASGTSYIVSWTWDTVSQNSATACKAQGLSGLASFTAPAASVSVVGGKGVINFAGLTTTTTSTPATFSQSSLTAGSWTYVTQGQSCTYNLKKSTSSATNLYISFAGLILFFVAYL